MSYQPKHGYTEWFVFDCTYEEAINKFTGKDIEHKGSNEKGHVFWVKEG